MEASWTQLRDNRGWGIRVVADVPPRFGDEIEVTKRSGERQLVKVATVLWTGRDRASGALVSLCTVQRGRRKPAQVSVSAAGTIQDGEVKELIRVRPADGAQSAGEPRQPAAGFPRHTQPSGGMSRDALRALMGGSDHVAQRNPRRCT